MQVSVGYKIGDIHKHLDLYLTNPAFMIDENKLKKINIEKKKVEEAKQEEFELTLSQQKGKPQKLSHEILEALKKEYGDIEIGF